MISLGSRSGGGSGFGRKREGSDETASERAARFDLLRSVRRRDLDTRSDAMAINVPQRAQSPFLWMVTR